jgi:hypothetical protein
MQQLLPEARTIRKLWIGEAGAYREHLLRLDAESRRTRFGGAVSDAFIRNYVDQSITLEAVIHGFFVDGRLRGAAELRPLGFAGKAEAALSVERPWQSRGVARPCSSTRCWPPAIADFSFCTWRASPTIGACSSLPGNSLPN